jgi:hypothetical protein
LSQDRQRVGDPVTLRYRVIDKSDYESSDNRTNKAQVAGNTRFAGWSAATADPNTYANPEDKAPVEGRPAATTLAGSQSAL